MLAAMTNNRVVIEVHAGFENDGRSNRLTPLLVGHAKHRYLCDRRVSNEHIFDVASVNIVAARDDHVLELSDNADDATLVYGSKIAGPVQTTVKRTCSLFGRLEITVEDMRSRSHDLADRTRSDFMALRVDDANIDPVSDSRRAVRA